MSVEPNESPAVSVASSTPAVKSQSKSTIIFALLAMVLSIVIALFAVFYTNDDSDGKAGETQFSRPSEDKAISPIVLSNTNESVASEVKIEEEPSQAKPEEVLLAKPQMPPLASYENSDVFIKEQLASEQWLPLRLSVENFPLLVKDQLLQRGIAFFDGLSRGELQAKVWPFARPKTAFAADRKGKTLWLGDVNFQRYTVFVQNIVAIDPESAVSFYRWTKPLWVIAYGELGYPPEKLNGALISAIDILLATPEFDKPIALKRESVLYQYMDAEIEALPGTQKQLLRMGPENREVLKNWLQQIRPLLLSVD